MLDASVPSEPIIDRSPLRSVDASIVVLGRMFRTCELSNCGAMLLTLVSFESELNESCAC